MVNRISCYTRKNKPWYKNSNTKKRVYIGKNKGIYYDTSKHSGGLRKKYISKQCKKHGTRQFWKIIKHGRGTSNKKLLKSKKMGTKDLYKDTEEGQALYKALEGEEIKHRKELLKMHSNLENIGLPKVAFYHDICYYLNDLKKISLTNGEWNTAALLQLDSLVPFIRPTVKGPLRDITNSLWKKRCLVWRE